MKFISFDNFVLCDGESHSVVILHHMQLRVLSLLRLPFPACDLSLIDKYRHSFLLAACDMDRPHDMNHSICEHCGKMSWASSLHTSARWRWGFWMTKFRGIEIYWRYADSFLASSRKLFKMSGNRIAIAITGNGIWGPWLYYFISSAVLRTTTVWWTFSYTAE